MPADREEAHRRRVALELERLDHDMRIRDGWFKVVLAVVVLIALGALIWRLG